MADTMSLDDLKSAFADGWKAVTDVEHRARIKDYYERRKADLTPPADDDFPGDMPMEGGE